MTRDAKGAILMVHGLCCGGEVWNRMAAPLRDQGFRVDAPTLHPDLRARVAPPPDLPKLNLEDYVAEMEASARNLEVETGRAPIAFGHSLGGLIAQKLAERGAVRAAVLFAPMAPVGVAPKLTLAGLFTCANMLFIPKSETKPVKVWKTGFLWGMLNCVPRERHEEIFATARYESGLVGRDLVFPDKDPRRTAHIDTARVTVPILTIGAGRDRAIPVEMHRRVAEKYREVGGDYLEYPDNAHWIIDEPGTDRVIADVASWLGSRAF